MIDAEFDPVDRPLHYAAGAVECIDAIRAALTPEQYRGYLRGQVMKYVWRCDGKHASPVEDLRKARWYLDKLIELG